MKNKFVEIFEQVELEHQQPITDDIVSFIINEDIELEVPVINHNDNSFILEPDQFVYDILKEENLFENEQGVAEGSLNEGQYEMMLRNGQVKKFVAKDDADAKRIAKGHGAKSLIKLKGGVPAGKIAEQGVEEGGPFSYGAKKPRKGSVAYNAELERKKRERNQPPIEPKDQMVGTAKVTKDVKEGVVPDHWPANWRDNWEKRDRWPQREIENAIKQYNEIAQQPMFQYEITPKMSDELRATKLSIQRDKYYGGVAFAEIILRQNIDHDTIGNPSSWGIPFLQGFYDVVKTMDNPLRTIIRRALIDKKQHWEGKDVGQEKSWPSRVGPGKQGVAEGSDKTFTVVYYSKKTDRNVTKQIKASSESELWDRLRAKGIDVVSVKEQGVAEGLSEGPDPFRSVLIALRQDADRYIDSRGQAGGRNFVLDIDQRLAQLQKTGNPRSKVLADTVKTMINDAQRSEIATKGLSFGTLANALMQLTQQELQKVDQQGVTEGILNELAPGFSGDGRWYTDYEIADIVGEDWLSDDLFSSGANMSRYGDAGKEQLKQEAQEYLENEGYSVEVLDVRDDEDHLSWLISGSMMRLGEQGVAEGLSEAKYQGREVKLGKPMAGDVKKYKVYVKDPQTGNIKKVNFGDKKLSIKRDQPSRRKNFRARHRCSTAKDRTSARYWSCRMWSSKPVSKILKGK